MNQTFNKRTLRKLLTLGMVSIFLWGLTAYAWYYAYLWIVSVTETSFFLTILVIPVPFVAYRLMARSRWLAYLSESKFAKRVQPLIDFLRWAVMILFVAGILVLVAPRLVTGIYTQTSTFGLVSVPFQRVAIIFGAGLLPDGSLSPLLKERVETAARLYLTGKAEKILMSGDNRFVNYNEPVAMQEYAVRLGVPENAIVLDYAGRRTYDTCYRAKAIFGVENAILVSQDYHLSRAIYTCRVLGIDAIGVAALKSTTYLRLPPILDSVRESLATIEAFWELYVSHPIPVLGKPEPVFLTPGR